MSLKLLAEFLGTFWLVLGGCGAAAVLLWRVSSERHRAPRRFAGLRPAGVVGRLRVRAGLGRPLQPTVTVGLWVAGRFPGAGVVPYVIAQVVGAILAAGVLRAIASGNPSFELSGGLASNGYGEHSPGQYPLRSGLLCEIVMTFMFVLVILGSTHRPAPVGFAGLAIGLALTLTHLVSIPVTNTSVNPARSAGPAVFVGDRALQQLWLF